MKHVNFEWGGIGGGRSTGTTGELRLYFNILNSLGINKSAQILCGLNIHGTHLILDTDPDPNWYLCFTPSKKRKLIHWVHSFRIFKWVSHGLHSMLIRSWTTLTSGRQENGKSFPNLWGIFFKCNSILGNNKSPVVGVAVDNKWPNERQRARRWSRSSPVQFPYYVEYPAPSSIIASLDHMNQPTESSMNSD